MTPVNPNNNNGPFLFNIQPTSDSVVLQEEQETIALNESISQPELPNDEQLEIFRRIDRLSNLTIARESAQNIDLAEEIRRPTIAENLDLTECTRLTALPERLAVAGDLHLTGCIGLTALPQGLAVERACLYFYVNPEDIEKNPVAILKAYTSHLDQDRLPIVQYTDSIGIDGGGITRDFITRLSKALYDQEAKDVHGFATRSLSMSELQIIEQVDMYKRLGKLFGMAYLEKKQILLGEHDSNLTFCIIQTLSSEEITQIPSDLEGDIPDEILEKLVSTWIEFSVDLAMPKEEKEKLIQEILQDNREALDIYGYTSKAQFLKETVYGRVAIAKGMYDLLGDFHWRKIQTITSHALQEKVEGVSISKERVLFEIEFDRPDSVACNHFKRWIKESESRKLIDVAQLLSEDKDNPLLEQKWIYFSALQNLIRASTGLTTLPPYKSGREKYIKIHIYAHSSSIEEEKMLAFHTCSETIDIPDLGNASEEGYKQFAFLVDTSLKNALYGDGFGKH